MVQLRGGSWVGVVLMAGMGAAVGGCGGVPRDSGWVASGGALAPLRGPEEFESLVTEVKNGLGGDQERFEKSVYRLHQLLGKADYIGGPLQAAVSPTRWWEMHDCLIQLDAEVAKRGTARQVQVFGGMIPASSFATALARVRVAVADGRDEKGRAAIGMVSAMGQIGLIEPLFWTKTEQGGRAIEWAAGNARIKSFFASATPATTAEIAACCAEAAEGEYPQVGVWVLASVPVEKVPELQRAGAVPSGPGGLYFHFLFCRELFDWRNAGVFGSKLARLPSRLSPVLDKAIIRYARRCFTPEEHAALVESALGCEPRLDALVLCRLIAELDPSNADLAAKVKERIEDELRARPE